jgi:hypothetical protein
MLTDQFGSIAWNGEAKRQIGFRGSPRNTMNRHFVLIIALLASANVANARTPWPERPKRSYAERCAESMSLQGLSPKTARTYCVFIADGMSKEFGMKSIIK